MVDGLMLFGQPRFGVKVGMHIGAAKAEDRLLGIADHEKPIFAASFDEQAPEDAPLDRVGVLELIDDGKAIAPAERAEKSLVMRVARGVQGLVYAREHVLETL